MLFSQINEGMFDFPWSVIHFVSGFLIALVFFSLHRGRLNLSQARWVYTYSFALLIGWELIELNLRIAEMFHPELSTQMKEWIYAGFFETEHWINILGDLLIGLAGIVSAHWLVDKNIHRKVKQNYESNPN